MLLLKLLARLFSAAVTAPERWPSVPRSTRSIRGRGSSGASTTSPLTARSRFRNLGPAYSAALRFAPPIYGALYHATNGRRRYRTIVRFCEPLYRERLKDVFTQYNPDVIVSVHPLLNHAALRARTDAGMDHVPIVTVITDLGRVHEGWLLPEADLTIVPAREVYARAIERGVPPEPSALDRPPDPSEVRRRLGDQERDPHASSACPQDTDHRAADGRRRRRRQTAADDARTGQDATCRFTSSS